MAFYPYPTDFPTQDALLIVLDAWRNKKVDPKQAVHGAWHLVGFGLEKWDPATPVARLGVLTEAKVDEAFRALQNPPRGSVYGSAEHHAALPPGMWSIIFTVAWEVIQRYFFSK